MINFPPVIRWCATEHGLATIEFLSFWLLADAALILVLGPDRIAQLTKSIDRIRDRLSPQRIPELARRLAVTWVGRVGAWVFGVIFAASVAAQIFEIIRAIHLGLSGASFEDNGLAGYLARVTQADFGAHASFNPLAIFHWGIRFAVAFTTIPVFFLVIWRSLHYLHDTDASLRDEQLLDKFGESLSGWQQQNNCFVQALTALMLTPGLLAGVLGMLSAWLLLVSILFFFRVVLKCIAEVTNAHRLHIGAAAAGLSLVCVDYIIKMFK